MSFSQYYKSELAFIHELARGFAEANPATASLLKERGSDPDVERLIEAFDFQAAGIRARMDNVLPSIVHGLAEPFGIAIDNARLFRQLRSASANDERRRIARDLHDQVGSSLAFLGFEVDRATHLAAQGEPMEATLTELRGHLTTVINDIRETLHDLRTDVTDERDLPATLRDHLARVSDRRRLATELEVDATFRPPRQVERELWQIALEAITNVEKHAQATTVRVAFTARENRAVLRISDDGIGLNTSAPRADRYGMVGMRERAEGIGASLRVESPASGGTSVTVTFDRVGSDTGEAGS